MPLAGVFISLFGFTPAVRLMFLIGSASTAFAVLYRTLKLKETEEGRRLVSKKNHYSFKLELEKFKESFRKIRQRSELFWFCIVRMLVVFALVMGNTFSTLFLTEKSGLGLNKTDITVLPFVFSMVMVMIMLIFIPSVKKEHYKKYLLRGTALAVAAQLIYVISPAGTTSFVLIAAVLSGIWMAFFRPLSDSYSMNILSDTERTRILSVFNTLLLISAIPAAPLAGFIFSYSPRLLFGIVAAILFAAMVIIRKKFSYGENKELLQP